MPSTPETSRTFDPLYDWGRMRDPLRTRHGMTGAEYGSAFEVPTARRSRISDRVLQLGAAFVAGAAVTLLFV